MMYHEQYGTVNLRQRRNGATRLNQQSNNKNNDNGNEKGNDGNHQRRHQDRLRTPRSSPSSSTKTTTTTNQHPFTYSHNHKIVTLVVPCLIALFYTHNPSSNIINNDSNSNNNMLLIITLYCTLTLYILDLANWKDGFHTSIWISFVIIAIYLLWDSFSNYTSFCDTWGSNTMSAININSISISMNQDGRDQYVDQQDGSYWQMESWSIFLFSICNCIIKVMFFYCLACWTVLQCQWKELTDRPVPVPEYYEYVKSMEQSLHFNLPISFSMIMSFTFLQYCNQYEYEYEYVKNNYEDHNGYNENNSSMSTQWCWSLIPFLIVLFSCWSIRLLCNIPSSFQILDDNGTNNNNGNNSDDDNENTTVHDHDVENEFLRKQQQQKRQQREKQRKEYRQNHYYTIPSSSGCLLSYIVLGIPLIIHILSYPIRWNNMSSKSNTSTNAAFESLSWSMNLLDFVFVVLVPYLIHSFYLHGGLWWSSDLSNYLNNDKNTKTTKKNILTMKTKIGTTTIISIGSILSLLVVAEILIQRYLIKICIFTAHSIHHNDQNIHSKVMISILLHCGSAMLGIAYLWSQSDYRRKWIMNQNNQNIGHNLVVDVNENDHYSMIMNIDEALAVILLIAGFCFGYAFCLPWYVLLNVMSIFIGFGSYIATRKLRYMVIFLLFAVTSMITMYLSWFRLVDKQIWIIPGLMKVSILQFHIIFSIGSSSCGIIYSLVTRPTGGVLENILAKTDTIGVLLVLYNIFVLSVEGVLLYEPLTSWGEKLYSDSLVTVTSFLLVGITLILKKCKVIKSNTYLLSVSLSTSKFVVSLVQSDIYSDNATNVQHANFLSSSVIAAMLIFVISMPFTIVGQIDSNRPRKNRFNNKPPSLIPKNSSAAIAFYSGILLPFAIFMSVPGVLKPLISKLLGNGRDAYYTYSLLTSEILGYSLLIWGTSIYSMLHYHLPNGGAESWKKSALYSFIIGLSACFMAPTFSMIYNQDNTANLIFASVSSMGSVIQRHERKGLWGLIAAVLAVLLALTGSLNLRKRNTSSTIDKLYFARFIIFSIVFGCGTSWFLIFHLIGDFTTFQTVVIVSSAMLISVMYTISSVLGYLVEERGFGDVIQMGKYSLTVASVSTLATAIFFRVSSNNTCESFSTLLPLWGVYSFLLATAIRSRRRKSTRTRALANLNFVFSWSVLTFAVYGYFGVASIGVSTNISYLLGKPASVIFTLPLASILTLLEGEPKKRYAKSMNSKKHTSFGIRFQTISDQQRFLLPFVATGITLILASAYVVLLRGFGNRWWTHDMHNSYDSVFQNNFGVNSRTTHHDDIADLARKHLVHSKMVAVTSKLAASGFWTSTRVIGPIMHLFGLLSVLPTWYSLLSILLKATLNVSHFTLIALVPFNLFPIFFCRGIPSLTVTATMGIAVTCHQYYILRHQKRRLNVVI